MIDAAHKTSPVLSVIHATRGRPEKALAARADYLGKALDPSRVEYLFVVDQDDSASLAVLGAHFTVVVTPKGCNHAFNEGVRVASGQTLVIAADDVVPPDQWDALVLERLGDPTKPKVLAVSDGHRKDRLMAHPILTRARLLQQGGTVFHPEYEGVFADTDFTTWAYQDGVVVEARDLVFRHEHPSFGHGEWDEGYRRQNTEEAYRKGSAIFARRFPRGGL